MSEWIGKNGPHDNPKSEKPLANPASASNWAMPEEETQSVHATNKNALVERFMDPPKPIHTMSQLHP
jgi:hypothetical protein